MNNQKKKRKDGRATPRVRQWPDRRTEQIHGQSRRDRSTSDRSVMAAEQHDDASLDDVEPGLAPLHHPA
jgi:hypothetical protein